MVATETSFYAQDVAESYSQVAREYDHFYSSPADLAENDVIYGRARRLGRGRKVVDIGCGPGTCLAWDVAPPGMYEGIDPSAGMIAQARAAHPGFAFIEGYLDDALENEAGLLLGTFGPLVHIDHPYPFALEAARACHRGGKIMLMAVPRPGKARITGRAMFGHDPYVLGDIFRAAGFENVRVRGFSWRHGPRRGPRRLLRLARLAEFWTIGLLVPRSCEWLIVEGEKA